MGARTRALDWSQTPVGPVESWPHSPTTAVSICLGSRQPICLWWGQQALTQFYNDGFISFLGSAKHPGALGQSAKECWSEIWQIISEMLEGVFATGEATWSEDFLYVLNRNLPREEGYFTFSYSPIRDDTGAVNGIFCACSETTVIDPFAGRAGSLVRVDAAGDPHCKVDPTSGARTYSSISVTHLRTARSVGICPYSRDEQNAKMSLFHSC
jgi:hypothetical protein